MLYGLKDFFTTSYAEGQRNKYQNLVCELELKIQTISSNISSAESAVQYMHSIYTSACGTNEGKFYTKFCEKEDDINTDVDGYIQKMSDALSELRGRKRHAKRQQEYWQTICDQEDKDQEEYVP